MKRRSRFPYIIQIGIAIGLGCLTGKLLGGHAEVLGEISLLVVQLLKTLATPLIFFAIVDAFNKTSIRARSAGQLLTVSGVNALVAGVIALSVSMLFPFCDLDHLGELTHTLERASTPQKEVQFEFLKVLKGLVPQNLFEPFLTNNVIAVVLVSIFLGLALRTMKNKPQFSSEFQVMEKFFSAGLHITQKLLSWIVKAVPFAVFGALAKIVGVSGFGFFSALGLFVGFVLLGMLLHVGVYYSMVLLFVARTSPLKFYRETPDTLITAFSTGSSLATLPITLQTLQEKLKVSPESSRLAACIGTNLNHDGILLYEAVAALFIAHIHGIHFGISQKVLLLSTSTLAAVGIAGVPDAGLITLSLVLGSVGLPLTFVPVLTSVDWLVGRFRATANVTSDMVVAKVLDRLR